MLDHMSFGTRVKPIVTIPTSLRNLDDAAIMENKGNCQDSSFINISLSFQFYHQVTTLLVTMTSLQKKAVKKRRKANYVTHMKGKKNKSRYQYGFSI